MLILAYCCVASMVPVWSLLQPRGYLGGFVLYFALALGVIGVFFGGYEIKQAAFKTFDSGKATGLLFPFLFVTIACGACSGFHGLVCSGTTSKQIARETHIRAVGYGGMLAEAFVAMIAMVTVMIVAQQDLTGLKPGTIYGNGIGGFLTLVIGRSTATSRSRSARWRSRRSSSTRSTSPRASDATSYRSSSAGRRVSAPGWERC
jgi:carbon starvation protein